MIHALIATTVLLLAPLPVPQATDTTSAVIYCVASDGSSRRTGVGLFVDATVKGAQALFVVTARTTVRGAWAVEIELANSAERIPAYRVREDTVSGLVVLAVDEVWRASPNGTAPVPLVRPAPEVVKGARVAVSSSEYEEGVRMAQPAFVVGEQVVRGVVRQQVSAGSPGSAVMSEDGAVLGVCVHEEVPNESEANGFIVPLGYVDELVADKHGTKMDAKTDERRHEELDKRAQNQQQSGDVPISVPGGVPGSAPPVDGPPKPSVMRVSSGMLAGKATKTVMPEYPPMAMAAGITGVVVVEVRVGRDGLVVSAKAVAGHPLLRDAAIDAAKQWEFRPTMVADVAVDVIGTITFNFKAPEKIKP